MSLLSYLYKPVLPVTKQQQRLNCSGKSGNLFEISYRGHMHSSLGSGGGDY